jgi:PKD repeat protein
VTLAACLAVPALPALVGPMVGHPAPSGGVVRVAPAYVPSADVRLVGPAEPRTSVSVVAALAPRDPAGMAAELAMITTPGSPAYGHYLTPAQIAAAYAPTPASYEAAVSYFTDRGLTVSTSPDRWAVTVTGPASAVGPAFGTELDQYQGPTGSFLEHPTPATLPSDLPWSGVLGLGTEGGMRPLVSESGPVATPPQPAASCSGSQPYVPCAIDDAYNVSSLLSAGDNGTGYTIGVVDVYDAQEPQGQLERDVQSFTNYVKMPLGTIHYLYPVPTTNDLNQTYTGWGSEEALDLEWTRGMAPGATIDMTFAPDPTTGLYSSVDWLVANQAVNVISLSWGEPDVGEFNAYAGACTSECNATSDGSYAILHPVMVDAALEGIGVFAASGDCGAAFGTNGVATSYPASDPAVDGVGATNLALSGTKYSSESAWSGNDSGRTSPGCQNQGGSGGGYSPFPRPAWQNTSGFPANVTVRGVPDVSIVGGSPVTIFVDGYGTEVEGTSVSCPIWAGLAAIADQVHGAPLGFLAPSLYELARSSNASKYFHDIVSGSNGYRAGKGWDPVTGIGSPIASNLFPMLGAANLTRTALFTNVYASPRSGTAPLTVEFSSATFNASSPVYGFDVAFGDGNSTWTSNGSAEHTYESAGVYLARSVAFLTDGNSSVSPPIAVVVGGGDLNVTLNASSLTPAAGEAVTLNATVHGGTSPYNFSYAFGDGTYIRETNRSSVVHVYPLNGTYCAVVVASDSASPPSGGASPRVAIDVGGSAAGVCHSATSVSASITPGTLLADLPGPIPFDVSASGGVPPYSVRLVSDDPYVTACSCGLFSEPGNHTVTAFVNDSESETTNVSTNVTLFPAIDASFRATPTIGPAPLTVNFTAAVSGGFDASAALTNWSFGATAPPYTGYGATASYTYTDPGEYVANAYFQDAAHSWATGTFLIDVLPAGQPNELAVSATVLPSTDALSGDPLTFSASASGGSAPYTYHWDLGVDASAYGPVALESYPSSFVGQDLPISLTVTDAAGTSVAANLTIMSVGSRPGTALWLNDSVSATQGATPFLLVGNATASGMPHPNITWSFGNGVEHYGDTASYTYLVPGNYTLTVVATDPCGDRIVHSQAITVTGLARTLPSVSGGPVASAGVAPFDVAFQVTAAGGAGPPYAYAWTFGDGGTGSGSPVDHTYASAGNYTANVTVTDSIGTPVTESYDIVVYNLTSVYVGASAPAAPLQANATFGVDFVTIPLCGVRSVPTCSVGPSGLRISLPGDPTNWTVSLNATGDATLETMAPSSAGTYQYNVVTVGQNYTGSTTFTINVTAPQPVVVPPPVKTAAPPPYWLYATALLIAAVVVVAVVVAFRRRRPTPAAPSP